MYVKEECKLLCKCKNKVGGVGDGGSGRGSGVWVDVYEKLKL